MIEAMINALDIKTPQIMVEAEILETTLGKVKDLGVEWGTGAEGAMATLIPATRTTGFPYNNWLGNVFGHLTPTSRGTNTSVTLGTLNTAQAVGVLQALESDTQTKILARPKVLTLDNERAVINLTSNQAIGFQSTTGESTSTTTATPERETTGVSLIVTPQVNEGGYVTMLVEPTVTGVVAASVSPPTSVGGSIVDPKTRSARLLVRVRNGETLVIGGLIDRSDRDALLRVPVLSGIPVFGAAFRNKEINNAASELVIFVSPRILEEPSGSQVAAGQAPFALREQDTDSSRQDVMEQSLKRLE